MPRFRITTPRKSYELEAREIESAILLKEQITYEEVTENEKEKTAGQLLFLKQGDQQWANVWIGKTNYTLKKVGCTTTAISVLTAWYGRYVTPAKLARLLTYNSNAEIIWKSINDVCPFDFVWRYYQYDKAKLLEILYSDDNSAIVRVPYAGAAHWLAMIGYDAKRGFIAIDPLYGDSCFVFERYGSINGFAEFKRS